MTSYTEFIQGLTPLDGDALFHIHGNWQEGGFGRVFRATVRAGVPNPWHLPEGSVWALKLFAPVDERQRVGTVPRWRYVQHELYITRHFGEEKQLLCLPEFKGAFIHHGLVAMVLEWIEGRDIHEWHVDLYRRGVRITEDMARTLARNVLKALEELHQANIVHRDIKPENIMVTDSDLNVRIIDLSFAKWINLPAGQAYPTTGPVTEAGTVPYNSKANTPTWAPRTREAYTISRQDLVKLDTFALGLIILSFFHTLTRQPADWRAVASGLPVSAELRHFLRRLLAPEAAERYAADDARHDPWLAADAAAAAAPALPAELVAQAPEPGSDAVAGLVGGERDQQDPMDVDGGAEERHDLPASLTAQAPEASAP